MLAGGMSRMLLSPTETSLKHFNGINIVTANSTHTKIYNPSGKEMMSGNIYASSDTPSVYLKNAAVNQYAITSSMHGTRLYGTNGIPLIQAGDYRIFIRKPGSTETNQNVFESMAIRLGKDVFEMRNPASDLVFFNASGGGITLYGLSGKKMLESIGNSNSLCYPLTGSVALSIGGVNGDSIEMNKIGSGSKFFYANSFEYGFTDAYGGLHGYDGDGIVLRPGYPNMYTKIPVGFVISNAPNPQSLDFFMTDYNAGGRLYRSSIDSAKNMLGIPASGAASLSDFSDHVAVDSSRWQSILDDRTKQWEAIEGLQNKTTSGSTPEDMLTTSETDAGYIVANALGGVVTYKTKAGLGLLLGSGTLTIKGVQEDKGLTLIGGVSGTKVVKDGDKVQSVNMESLTFTPYIAA
jgi:hypothetical protein